MQHRYYTREGRHFTITAYPVGNRYLCLILTAAGAIGS